jgi:hypothetical protein
MGETSGEQRWGHFCPEASIAIPNRPPDREWCMLIGCEGDRTLKAVLVGMLREADGGRNEHLRAGVA